MDEMLDPVVRTDSIGGFFTRLQHIIVKHAADSNSLEVEGSWPSSGCGERPGAKPWGNNVGVRGAAGGEALGK